MKKNYLLLASLLIFSCSRNLVNENPKVVKVPIKDVLVSIKTGDFTIGSFNLIKSGLIFSTIAVGRETKLGADDGPRIKMGENGICHPSIIYIPEGVNGYQYWCAMTPRFGIINQQPDIDAFENPHIFCSKDGITWIEPNGISNPIDKAIKGPWINYWSDTNLVYKDKTFYLYYRGCGFPYSFFGDKNTHLRATVVKKSIDGINWGPRKLLFATSRVTQGIDDQSVIASPSVVEDNGKWYLYDLVHSSAKNPYESQGNQTSGFVFRRSDDQPDGSFGSYSADKICNFENRPWGMEHDPWHLEVVKYDSKFFMLLCTGKVGKSNGSALWLAYSKDGVNFKVIPTPLFQNDTYKSAIVPESSTPEKIIFKIYQSEISTGKLNMYNLILNKI